MTLQELRYLVALADTGHFVSAARACHVGQPTLSMQIKKLETYLGMTLFERAHQKVEPTEAGLKIIEQARVALDVVEHIRELARQAHDPMEGTLRLGVIPTLGPYLIPRMLSSLRASFPKFRLQTHEARATELLDGLRLRQFDALMLSLPVPARNVETLPLFREPLMVALPARHAFGKKRHIRREELAGQDILLLEEGHCLRRQAFDICALSGRDEDQPDAGSLETLCQMVAANLGCTLLPALASLPYQGSTHNSALRVLPFAQPVPTRTIAMVWRRRCPGTAAVNRLARFIQANLPSVVDVFP